MTNMTFNVRLSEIVTDLHLCYARVQPLYPRALPCRSSCCKLRPVTDNPISEQVKGHVEPAPSSMPSAHGLLCVAPALRTAHPAPLRRACCHPQLTGSALRAAAGGGV